MDVLSKVCTRCRILKPLDNFTKQSTGKYGHTARCKACERELAYIRERGHKITYIQRPLFVLSKPCSRCKIEKPIEDFRVDQSKKDSHRYICKQCEKEEDKKRFPLYSKQRKETGVESAYRHKWRITHQERERERERRKYRDNPTKTYARSAKRRARKMQVPFEEIRYTRILQRYGYICHICGGAIASRDDLHFDHVVPLAKGGSHMEENIKPSHKVCNLRKGDKLMEELSDFQRRGP